MWAGSKCKAKDEIELVSQFDRQVPSGYHIRSPSGFLRIAVKLCVTNSFHVIGF